MANALPSGGRPGYPPRRNTDPFANIRRNHRIKADQIRVISPDGKQLGVLPTGKALQLAQQFELDLVEVAPNVTPPVCRIMDFGKYMYEESKKHSHVKTTASKIKEIEFSVRIEQNDFITKLRHAEEFLEHGNKVKLRLKFRGREMARTEMGFDVVNRAIVELEGMGHSDGIPKLTGRNIYAMLTPVPVNKRKAKFHLKGSEAEPVATAPAAPSATPAAQPDSVPPQEPPLSPA
jgi:translation initiation factor IF-3